MFFKTLTYTVSVSDNVIVLSAPSPALVVACEFTDGKLTLACNEGFNKTAACTFFVAARSYFSRRSDLAKRSATATEALRCADACFCALKALGYYN